jgi:uncharacterized protein YsxB (DUF464 family)
LIDIGIYRDGAGVFRRCRANGHAGAGVKGGARGGDIVCAAASVLLRSMAAVLRDRPGITVHVDAPERGVMLIEADCSEQGRPFLQACSAFLEEGLTGLAAEFPANCRVSVFYEDAVR